MKTFKTLLAELWDHPFTGTEDYPNVQENEKKLKEHFHGRIIAHADKHHILKYTQGSRHLNNRLIDEYTHGPDHDIFETYAKAFKTDVEKTKKYNAEDVNYETKRSKSIIKGLDSIFSKKKIFLPHSMHLYTGVRFNPAELKQDDIIHLPAFTSTSISPEVAASFGRKHHIIKIHTPAGSKGIFVHPETHGMISRHTDWEKEVILNRNAKISIHPEPETDPNSTLYNDIKIWHARLIHDGIKPTVHMPK